MWFINSLMWSIIICFLFRKTPKILFIIGIIFYLFGLVAKAYSSTPIGIHVSFNTRNGPFFGTIFFITGYFLSKINIESKTFLKNGLYLFLIGITMHFVEIFILWKYYNTSPLQDYVIGTYFMGIGISLIALSNHRIFHKLSRVINVNKIGSLVIGIYLIHFVFVDNLRSLKLIYRPFSDFVYTFLVFIFSYYSVLLLSKNNTLKSALFYPIRLLSNKPL